MTKLKKFKITESTYIWSEDIESVKEIAKEGCEVEEVKEGKYNGEEKER